MGTRTPMRGGLRAMVSGTRTRFVNQAADMLRVIGGGEPVVPLPDFADALETQKVLAAALISAREHSPVDIGDL